MKKLIFALSLFCFVKLSAQTTGIDGVRVIKSFEGCQLKAYKCPAGVWTIGYGNTSDSKAGLIITKEKAEALLIQDLRKFERNLLSRVSRPLAQYEFDALISFTYNLGSGVIKDGLKENINRGSPEVPSQITKYNRAKVNGKMTTLRGLTRRRITEARLYETGILRIEK